MLSQDNLPRSFQANIDRFYRNVIHSTLSVLPVHPELRFGKAESIEISLDMARAQTENHTANEAAKAFALVLAGLFERQMRIWIRSRRPINLHPKISDLQFKVLLAECALDAKVDLAAHRLGHILEEMFLVANVFRHGDGRSSKNLSDHSPELWNYHDSRYRDILPVNSDESEKLLLQPRDLARYATACSRFWGNADKLDGAVEVIEYEQVL